MRKKVNLLLFILTLFLSANQVFSQNYIRPEGVAYDPGTGYYYISCVGEYNTEDGIIYKVDSQGNQEAFVSSGLSDPKGMVIVDGVLYVTDINYIRGYDLISGEQTVDHTVYSGKFLNDICADSSNNLYVTDTQNNSIIKFDITQNQEIGFWINGDVISPNGIMYDFRYDRLIFVNFVTNGSIFEIHMDNRKVNLLRSIPYSYLDGIAIDNMSNILISAWGSQQASDAFGKILKYQGNFNGSETIYMQDLSGPADIYFNPYNDSLVIPQMNSNTVNFINYGPATAPSVPTLISPDNNSVTVDTVMELCWNYTPGATYYKLQVAENEEFNPVKKQYNKTDTSKVFSGLEMDVDYFWRVQSANGFGSSAWSEIRSFKRIEASYDPPTLLEPTNDTTCIGLHPVFKWTGSEVKIYELQVDSDPDFSLPLDYKAISITIDTTDQIIPNVLTENTKYYWRVRTYSGNQSSDWSEVFNFHTTIDEPEVPNLVTPLNEEGGQSIRTFFEWNEAENCDYYQITVSKDNFVNDTSFIDDVYSNSSIVSYTINQNLDQYTTYYWKVRGANTCHEGEWSNVRTFTTMLVNIEPAELLSPEDSASIDPNPELVWEAFEHADNYTVLVADNYKFSNPTRELRIDTNAVTVMGLKQEKDYFWKVRTNSGSTFSNWSDIRMFYLYASSVEDSPALSYYSLYPNPATDKININMKVNGLSHTIIDIYNTTGNKINNLYNSIPESDEFYFSINTSDYPAGTYIMLITNTSGSNAIKFNVIK